MALEKPAKKRAAFLAVICEGDAALRARLEAMIVFFTGTGQTNQWEITATAEGRAAFRAGPATVVGLARSSVSGQTTDAHQWLVNATLVSE